jgi:hypothetical protein
MNKNNNTLECLRHRLLFAEQVKQHLLEVAQDFLKSPEGQGFEIRHADRDASSGRASFELRADHEGSNFLLGTEIDASGHFKVEAAEFWHEGDQAKSNTIEFSRPFDPFQDDSSEVASNVLLGYQDAVDENYISARLVQHVWPLIGRQRPHNAIWDCDPADSLGSHFPEQVR